eukprot:6221959-Amphidinium_carterae.1
MECLHSSMNDCSMTSPTFGQQAPWPDDLMHFLVTGTLCSQPTAVSCPTSIAGTSGGHFSFSQETVDQHQQEQGFKLGSDKPTNELTDVVRKEVGMAMEDLKKFLQHELLAGMKPELEKQCRQATCEA